MNSILEQINSAGLRFVEFALPMFVQSGLLILISLLADFALRKKVRAVFRYWIWLLVLVKLILPTSLSTPVSLGYFFGDELAYVNINRPAPEAESRETAPAIVSPMINPSRIEAGSDTSAIPPTAPTIEPAVIEPVNPPVASLSWQGAVFLLWVAVMLAMGLLLLQRAVFVRSLIAQAKEANDSMVDTLESCRERMRVKQKIGLKVSVNANSPAVCGLFRPVILVPQNLASSLNKSQLKTVLLHELAHIRRGDLWINLAQTFLQIIYFYNPLLWLANCIIRRIREQAVDEMVLVAMGEKAQQYPQTLVDVAKLAFKRPALSLRLIGVVESKSALAGRIKHILNHPMPKRTKLGILGLLVVIIIGAILLPMAACKPGPPSLVIKGTVKDAQTQEPIAGARVFDDGYAHKPNWEQIKADVRSEWGAITNSTGQYSFLTWPEHHSIKVEALGYKSERQSLYDGHFIFKTKDKEIFDFALEPEKASDLSEFKTTLLMAKAQKSEKTDMPTTSGTDKSERTVDKSGLAVPTAKPEPATMLRKLRVEWGGFASLSPDGEFMCDVDWDTGDLVVRELVTGEQRYVTNKGSFEDSVEYALDSAISPDSEKVAYLWHDPNPGNSNLYTIGLDVTGRKLLRANEYLIPRDWSSDGKQILGILLGKPKEMVWVSCSDGSIRRIKAVGMGYPGKFDVSPDGRYIAYDLPQGEGSTKRDIFLFAIDENREIPLVQHPAHDRLLGWTPDGNHIFFVSDRMGGWDGWLLNVADGKRKGLPELVKPQMGDVQPIGFTPKGDYYFGIYHNRYNVYTAMLDLQAGKDLSTFKTIGYTGTENLPDWSPDGQYLVYCTGLRDNQVIHIRSLATGQERELDPNLPFFSGLRWSPDGRSLLASGFRGDEGLSQVIYRVDVQTGEHTALSQTQKGEIRQAGLSSDGKSLFYEREGGIVVKDLETGREKEIFRAMPPMQMRDWALSPDGQRLVFSLGGTKGSTLKIISTTGGEPRELLGETWARGIREFEIRAVTWMPDNQSVLFRIKWQEEKGGGELWWISAEGGEPRKIWVSKKDFGRLRVHPDGQHIAFNQHDLIYELWVMENFLPAGG